MGSYRIVRLSERSDLTGHVSQLHREGWPRFMRQDAVVGCFWNSLLSTFGDFQILLCTDGDTVVGVGHSIPLAWDGTVEGLPEGLDAELEQGATEHDRRVLPNTLGAVAVVVARNYQQKGLSPTILQAMRSVAAEHHFKAMIAPVRPTLKSRYPLIPMDRYVEWAQPDGSPFDPWIRIHWRLGARRLRIAPRSMVITGSVAEWEDWTEMRFPEGGVYVVPGALQPIRIDRERDLGLYEDPNVWMRHDITDDRR